LSLLALCSSPLTCLASQRIKEFNYAGLNATPFVALENNAPNAYTNPVLQVLFALAEVSGVRNDV
jgi:hypothetical protein